MISKHQPKAKTCPICEEGYYPRNSLQKTCQAISCALEHGRQREAEKKRKALKASDKKRLDAIQPLSHWMKLAQRHFNAFIVVRDTGKPCISCYEYVDLTCGHHKTVAGFPELRLNTMNANGQCRTCNCGSAKHRANEGVISKQYDAGVVSRFGVQRLDYVNSRHPAKQYREADLKRIAAIFRKRAILYKRIRAGTNGERDNAS